MWAWLAAPRLDGTSGESRVLLSTQNLCERQTDRLRAAAGPPIASARPPGGPFDQLRTRDSLEPRGVLIDGFVTSRARRAFASKKHLCSLARISAFFGGRSETRLDANAWE